MNEFLSADEARKLTKEVQDGRTAMFERKLESILLKILSGVKKNASSGLSCYLHKEITWEDESGRERLMTTVEQAMLIEKLEILGYKAEISLGEGILIFW